MEGLRTFALFILVGFCALLAHAKTKDCSINFKKDLRLGHPLFLKPNSSEFLYPTEEKMTVPTGEVGLRVACPGGNLLVKKKMTNLTIAGLLCASKGKFQLAGDNATAVFVQLKDLTCSAGIQSSPRLLPSKGGLQRAEIGLQLGAETGTEFLPAIEEVVAGVTHGLTVRWAKTRVAPTILKREIQKIAPTYRKGVFFQDIELNDVYVRANQRTSFLEIFNDTAKVDKYLPETGDKYFVQSQLVSHEDLFYAAQQDAAYVYDNVVPVWETVSVNGNWKLVGELIRSLASQSVQGLDVWSGSYQQLYIEDEADVKFISLTHGVEPSKFLYKYVHDPATNKGLVFITVNNPHLEKVSTRDIICDKYSSCDIQYPEFINLGRGYTYCCRLDDFRYYASVFELPTFPGATPLI